MGGDDGLGQGSGLHRLQGMREWSRRSGLGGLGGPWLKWEPQRRARFGEGKKLSLGCIALHLIGL